MRTVTEPLTEEEILAVTSEEATGDQIAADMETRAQCCVNHLCGCN